MRKRVQNSVVRSEIAAVPGGAARFVARRVPGINGISWWARLQAGTPDSPVVRAAVSARIAALEAAWNAAD